jgi:hypothetical protein
MDTARTTGRRSHRLLVAAIVPALLLFGAAARADTGTTIAPGIVVHDANPAELDLVRWAVGRYEAGGLSLPPLQVYVHDTAEACGGETGLGFYRDGRLDLCPGTLINAMTRHTILHEMAHAFTEQHDSPTVIARFDAERGLPTWDSWDYPWLERGWEQATDIVAWGIGERIITPRAPDATPEDLAQLYQLLTDTALPGSSAEPASVTRQFIPEACHLVVSPNYWCHL